MGIRFEWDDPNRKEIMLFLVRRPWTWEEYDEIADQAFAVLAQQSHPVATIVDVTQGGKLPLGSPMPHLRRVYRLMPPTLTVSVVVGGPPAIRLFINVLASIYPRAK